MRVFQNHVNIDLVYLDKISIFLIIFLLAISSRPDLVILSSFFLIIPYIYLTDRLELYKVLISSFLLSLAWMAFSKENYFYSPEYLTLLGINLYALFSWTAGLMGIYIIYLHYEEFLKRFSKTIRFVIFSFTYIFFLLLLEFLFFNFFGVQNLAAVSYPGLAICNCLHAPLWMQISYLIIGPIYYLIMQFVRFKNPHFIKKRKSSNS